MSDQSIEISYRQYEYDDNGDVINETLKKTKTGFKYPDGESSPIFQMLFCNSSSLDSAHTYRAPIELDMNVLAGVYNGDGYRKNGTWNGQELYNFLNDDKYHKDSWKYLNACHIMSNYREYLSVEGNPNKLLKLALDYRKMNKNKVSVFDKNYVGLDRIGWFLNLSSFFNKFPIKRDENENKLQFDKEVLTELLNQFYGEAIAVEEKIGKDKISQYKRELYKYYDEYRSYRNQVYETSNQRINVLKESWNQNPSLRKEYNNFAQFVSSNTKNNLFNCKTFYEWMIDRAESSDKKINPEKVEKLLRLDSVLRCHKEVDKFIGNNGMGLEELTSNWSQRNQSINWLPPQNQSIKISRLKYNYNDKGDVISTTLEETRTGFKFPDGKSTLIAQMLFCNSLPLDGLPPIYRAPIDLGMNGIERVYEKAGYSKKGTLNWQELSNLLKAEPNDLKYIKARRTMIIYDEYLSVPGNPNKLLKLALDYRKINKNKVSVFNKNYVGLDRIGWFLNLSSFFNKYPMQRNDNKNKLQFDKTVLTELLNQFNEEAKVVEKTIGNDNIANYKYELYKYHMEYQQYQNQIYKQSNKKINNLKQRWNQDLSLRQENYFNFNHYLAVNGEDNLFNCPTFYEWMIDRAKSSDKKIKINPEKVEKLLRLDGVLRCRKEVDKFIKDNSRSLEESTLNWFQQAWNNLVRGTFIAKLGLFFSPSLKTKSDPLISDIDNEFKTGKDNRLFSDNENI